MRRCLPLLLISGLAVPAAAQGLRDRIGDLFIFGSGQAPLFLAGTAGANNPVTIQAHGTHFIPSAVSGNATLIQFLTAAIGSNITNLPVSATSSGRTFRFEGGAPVATSTSPGPIFAERAPTLGRGRVLAAVTTTDFDFRSVRGVDLGNIELAFTHANTTFPGCDSVFAADCTKMGAPTLENDFIQLRLGLDLHARSTQFVLSYGLLDWLDIGVAVPVVSTSLRGTSQAQIVPFGGPTATHFFAGTPSSPELTASRFVEGSATGLGDIAARIKARLTRTDQTAFAVLADARFSTGDEGDLLGSGASSIRGLGILSARFGAFSPHVNVGYVYRTGAQENDAVLLTAGFDHVLAGWATLAVEFLGELQAGASALEVPGPVTIEIPFRRTIIPANITNRRDDLLNAALGFKLQAAPGLTIVANALWPLNRGGLRTNIALTAGLEYNF